MTFAVICAASVAALLIILAFLAAPRAPRKFSLPQKGYAHRGLWNNTRPENSVSAFAAACDAGYAIETDVQLTSDNVPVIFHDSSLRRVCGVDKKVCELTYRELTQFRLSGSDETIPTFESFLSLVNGRVPLLIELKGETTDTALCDVIAPMLQEYKGEFVTESFNPMLLGRLKKLCPEIIRGQLRTIPNRLGFPGSRLRNFALGAMLTNFISRPDFIAYDKQFPHSLSLIVTTRLFGARRCVWTVRSFEEYGKCISGHDCPIFENIEP